MRLRVGSKKFGEVPDEKVKAHQAPSPNKIHEAMIQAIVNLIRRYATSEKDRARIRKELR